MLKISFSLAFLLLTILSYGQRSLEDKMQQQSAQNKFNEQSNTATTDDEWDKTFNGLNHPLAIIGGILTIGGAGTYIAGSEGQNNHNYQPNNTTQYVGIGLFATGAILFTVFATEHEKGPKRKKVKQKYNASDWEAPE